MGGTSDLHVYIGICRNTLVLKNWVVNEMNREICDKLKTNVATIKYPLSYIYLSSPWI